MPYDMNELLRMSPAELDALFAKSPLGPIPDGEAKGVAIPFPGSALAPGIAKIATAPRVCRARSPSATRSTAWRPSSIASRTTASAPIPPAMTAGTPRPR